MEVANWIAWLVKDYMRLKTLVLVNNNQTEILPRTFQQILNVTDSITCCVFVMYSVIKQEVHYRILTK